MSQRLSKLVQYLEDGNYEMAVTTYNQNPQKLSQYQALQLARAFLANEHYEKCIQQCENYKSHKSLQIFFDANILFLKAAYLRGSATTNIIKQLQSKVKITAGFEQRHIDTVYELGQVLQYERNSRANAMSRNQMNAFAKKFRYQLQKQQNENPLEECMPMFIVANKWFQKFLRYSGLEESENETNPGPITHFQILDHRYSLLHDPNIHKRYMNYAIYPAARVRILPKKCWMMLKDVFKGNELKRYNVWVMEKPRQIITQIYLKKIRVKRQESNQVYEIQITKKQTWAGVSKKIKSIWKDQNRVILQQHQSTGFKQVNQNLFLQQVDTCGKVFFYGKPPIVVPIKSEIANALQLQSCKNCGKKNDLRFCQCKSVKYCDARCQKQDRQKHRKKCQLQCNHLKQKAVVLQNFNLPQKSYGGRKGLVGLRNLGNTCYMNSGLQCLSNTKQITQYFMSNKFITEINQNNPLGTKGYLACAYAELMRQMWTGSESSISPFNLKKIIGRFATQFSGYGQQDSQQFISYLIDGLQEDLNLVKNKKTFETTDEIIPDQEASRKSQLNYEKRTKSYIRDLMVGQFKSTVVCKSCKKVSICFDPYMLLALPIPALKQKQVYFIAMNCGIKTKKITFTMDGETKVGHLRQALCDMYDINEKNQSSIVFSIVDLLNFEVIQQNLADRTSLIDVYAKMSGDYTVLIAYELVSPQSGQFRYEIQYQYDGKIICFPRYVNMPINPSINDTLRILDKSVTRYLRQQRSIQSLVQNTQIVQNKKIIVKLKSKVDMLQCMSEHKPLRLHSIQRRVNLYDCMQNFTRKQVLQGNNKWYCNKCKQFMEATKQMQIYKSNKILVVAFKRFSRGFKVKDFIDFPVQGFNMGPYVKSNASNETIQYDLYGVVNHYGTMSGGHYTAYCKNYLNNQWFEFDDSRVSKVRVKDVITQSAYVLFYRKK